MPVLFPGALTLRRTCECILCIVLHVLLGSARGDSAVCFSTGLPAPRGHACMDERGYDRASTWGMLLAVAMQSSRVLSTQNCRLPGRSNRAQSRLAYSLLAHPTTARDCDILTTPEPDYTMSSSRTRWIQAAEALSPGLGPLITRAAEAGPADVPRQLDWLLQQRRLPDAGLDDRRIEALLTFCASLDSNNAPRAVGAGERESRVWSSLVARRHWYMGHGVGRSGDIAAVQPKAAGSSLIYQLCNVLARDALRTAGLRAIKTALVLPVATGMSLSLTLRAVSMARPAAKYVLWSRIDQKACFKAILAAGLTPVIIELSQQGDGLHTNVPGFQRAIARLSPGRIAAVVTTTSCFAPRVPDDVRGVAQLAAEHGIPHVVNNAYGVCAGGIMAALDHACKTGRVDACVQSTDKNFMVPVGGAIVASPRPEVVLAVSQGYPGRASAAPIADLFITLLSMGASNWQALRQQRKAVASHLRAELQRLAHIVGERVLHTPANPISMALTLTIPPGTPGKVATELGSMLFTRGITGARVVAAGAKKPIEPFTFLHWGSQAAPPQGYQYCAADEGEGEEDAGPVWETVQGEEELPATPPPAYLTVAAAIGMTMEDVDDLIQRLQRALLAWRARMGVSVAEGASAQLPEEAESA